MTEHDYAGCSDPACGLCETYGEGWAHGKVKMAAVEPSGTPWLLCYL